MVIEEMKFIYFRGTKQKSCRMVTQARLPKLKGPIKLSSGVLAFAGNL